MGQTAKQIGKDGFFFWPFVFYKWKQWMLFLSNVWLEFFILFIYSEMLLNSVVEVKVKILKIIETMQHAALLS